MSWGWKHLINSRKDEPNVAGIVYKVVWDRVEARAVWTLESLER